MKEELEKLNLIISEGPFIPLNLFNCSFYLNITLSRAFWVFFSDQSLLIFLLKTWNTVSEILLFLPLWFSRMHYFIPIYNALQSLDEWKVFVPQLCTNSLRAATRLVFFVQKNLTQYGAHQICSPNAAVLPQTGHVVESHFPAALKLRGALGLRWN